MNFVYEQLSWIIQHFLPFYLFFSFLTYLSYLPFSYLPYLFLLSQELYFLKSSNFTVISAPLKLCIKALYKFVYVITILVFYKHSSPRSTCMTENSLNRNRNRKSDMSFRFPDQLPGQLYDAVTQCRWQFGSEVTVCPFNFAKVSLIPVPVQFKRILSCRVYTRTHVARKHVSRTSNLYPDTYIMSTDTCRRIQVARPGYSATQ